MRTRGPGDRIAADRAARIWRVWNGSRSALRTLRRHTEPLVDASFSPDGSTIVTASAERTARLWSVRSGQSLHVLTGHHGALTSAVFSPNGKLVVTASRDHEARVWKVATGRTLQVLRAHYGSVSGASFSPDGRWIVTAGPGAAGLWRTGADANVALLFGSKYPLNSAVFSRDGRFILTAGVDGTVRMYRCEICGTLPDLVALAEKRLARTGRKLTPAQRNQYLHP